MSTPFTSFASILVPLDGSPFAERALPAAVALASRTGAALELVHVHDEPPRASGAPGFDLRLDSEVRAATCQALDGLEDRLVKESRLEIILTCLQGPVAKTLEEHIASKRPDLVVAATHGASGMERALIGSVADHIVRHSATPVLLVRPGAIGPLERTEPLFRHIILPLDGSALAEQVIDRVVPLASAGATRITLVQVVAVPIPLAAIPFPANAVPIERADTFDRQRRELLPYLERIAAELRGRGFESDASVISHWQVGQGILEFARDRGADLIALGTRGHGGVRRFVLGSVASAVIHGAVTPVLVFHPAEAREDRELQARSASRPDKPRLP